MNKQYLYVYNYSEEEKELCMLELRTVFGFEPADFIFKSDVDFGPGRSPFIRERLDLLLEAPSLEDLKQKASLLKFGDESFKTVFVQYNRDDKVGFSQRRRIEREVGIEIQGNPSLDDPDRLLGIAEVAGRWYLGNLIKQEAVWLRHVKKPREYSTALSTRVARAVVNIAVPRIEGVRAIDPCCGIGTVLVEALSMGIDITGRDINPLAASGSKENVLYFGYDCDVAKGAIEQVEGHYEAAIIDMPYDLCTTATPEQQLSILRHAKRIADRAVIVTSEPMDGMIEESGLGILDRCTVRKQAFIRQIIVCG